MKRPLWSKSKAHSVFKFSDNLSALSQMYPPADEASSQVDIWSDFGSGWPLVRCAPQAETFCGQVCYYFGSGLNFVISLGQVDLWSDVPTQAKTSCSKVYYYFGSGWHFFRSSGQLGHWSDVPPDRDIMWPSVLLLQVRLTFCQIFGQINLS